MSFTTPLTVSIGDEPDYIKVTISKDYFLRAWVAPEEEEVKCTFNCGNEDFLNSKDVDEEIVEEVLEEEEEENLDDGISFDENGNPIFDDSNLFEADEPDDAPPDIDALNAAGRTRLLKSRKL